MPEGRAFFDTNIFLYSLSGDSIRAGAVERLLSNGGAISVQVLNEFTTVARRKWKLDWPEIRAALSEFRTVCRVLPLTVALHDEGLQIAERYGFSIYDSMIVSAAISSGCDTLYSEDFQSGQMIGSLTIQNPFL